MQPDLDRWTVVLAGQWNRALLSSQWLAQNVTHTPEIQVQVIISNGEAILKYATALYEIVPTDNSLVVAALADTNEAAGATILAARRIVELLPHTPLRGVGVNYGFTETEPPAALLDLFNDADVASLSQHGEVIARDIARCVQMESGVLLNLRLTLSPEGHVLFHFNFHRELTEGGSALDALGDACLDYLPLALNIVENNYLTANVEA